MSEDGPKSFPIFLFIFIAAKIVGSNYMALWSWWWLLMPVIPVFGTLIHYFLS